MRNIYVYTGIGAYQAKDVENFLGVFGLPYVRLQESELSKLKPQDILIVPGGQIKAYLPAWGNKGIKTLRKFVFDGGIYVGICSGVYVAGSNYAEQPGLNFFPNKLEYKKGQGTIKVSDKSGKKYQLIFENGPDLSVIKSNKTLLAESNGQPQAIQLNLKKGQVFLFASHPEGSVYYKKPPYDFSGALFFSKFLKSL